MDEIIERLGRVESTQTAMRSEVNEHIADEAADLKAHGHKLDRHGDRLSELAAELGEVKSHLARQKGFVAGMLFAITALGYVIVEGLKRIVGTV